MAGAKNTNGNNLFQKVPIHFWFTRRLPSVSDYGYSNWPIHPVSSTIFPSLELSCNACYNITFKLFVRQFLRKCLPERSPAKATFSFVFSNSWLVKSYFQSENCFAFSPTWKKPKSLLVFCFCKLTFQWTFYGSFICCWTWQFNASIRTSASSERGSGDPDDRVSGSIKYLLPSPFIQSGFLSLVWWYKNKTTFWKKRWVWYNCINIVSSIFINNC